MQGLAPYLRGTPPEHRQAGAYIRLDSTNRSVGGDKSLSPGGRGVGEEGEKLKPRYWLRPPQDLQSSAGVKCE